MLIKDPNYYLMHYGTKRHSGRYPWGSGGDNDEAVADSPLLKQIAEFKKQGMTESQIAAGLGMSTTKLRAQKSIAKNERKQEAIAQAEKLLNKGYSVSAIGRKMNLNESSVRSLLAPGQKDKLDVLHTTANMLKEHVDTKGYIDVSSGVEHQLNITDTKLKQAVALLQEKGYAVHVVQIPQLGTAPGQKTSVKVLAPPGTKYLDIKHNPEKITQVFDYSTDGGRSFNVIQPPLSINSKRVAIRYAEEGGDKADGVVYVRRGVDDISLGASQYAQVRIAVDGTHYIKGMAMYKDDMPTGVDLMFNTNKSNTGNKKDAMKPLKLDENGNLDPDNPFGSMIRRQRIDPKTNKVTSVMNIVREEGDWDTWSRNISSQTLSKQSPKLAQSQLKMTYEKKKNDLERISALTNPLVKQRLLLDYANELDSAAVRLQAEKMSRSSWHVILPFDSLKDNEIYAPNYRNGERVALIRYPHAGTFEIPELIVNNKSPKIKSTISQAKDAVGINSKVAKHLSGADFDGDTVMVIPNNRRQIKTSPALQSLKDFDPIHEYPKYDGMKSMTNTVKQHEMGKITNLIADMTIKGAKPEEIARAVKHSMVVIDAEKHDLNWKASAVANGIPALKKKYQDAPGYGASTLITRAGSRVDVPLAKPRSMGKGGPIDPLTGRKVFEKPETWVDSQGRTRTKMRTSVKLAETEDAHTLSSGSEIENIYADHSNRLKALANDARKEAVSIKGSPRSPSAAAVYKDQVDSLNSKLRLAISNRPLERQAQIIANAQVKARVAANPDMDGDTRKKIESLALETARNRMGAHKQRIDITDKEWDAIQAGAISPNRLSEILSNSDLKRIRTLATPREAPLMTPTKLSRARLMSASGYTQAEIADALGVSLSTLKEGLK